MIKRKNKEFCGFYLVLRFLIITGLFLFSGCSLFAKNTLPYLVQAEMTIDESADYEIAGLDFTFYNREQKKVKEFTVVFCLFDQEGNPVNVGKSNLVLTVSGEVEGKTKETGCISLDSYLYEVPEEEYQVDFLYVSRIVYEDDTEWTDSFGLLAF